jgi:PAS domain S-box-containing protein
VAARPSVGLGLLRSALLGVFVAGLAFLVNGTDLFQAFELRTVDLRFRLRGSREVKTPLAVVFIGDDSIAELGRWPWSWERHALLVDALERAGARLVLFDILFTEPPSPEEVDLLAGVTRRAGNVFYISYFNDLAPEEHGPAGALMAGTGLTEPLPALRGVAAGVGHANARPDLDGTTRRVPLLVHRGPGFYPSAAFRIAAELLGVPVDRARVTPGGEIELRPAGRPPVRIPLDGNGETDVNYAGGKEAFPVQFSYRQVLQADRFPALAAVDLSQLKGRVVLVGAAFTGNTDLRPTPFSPTYPMILVQANMIDNIVRGEFVRRPPGWASLLICTVLGALLGVMTFSFRPLASLGFTAAAAAAYTVAAVAAFTRGAWQLQLVAPLTAILAAYILVTTAQYVETRKEKLRALERLKYLGHLVESATEAIFSFDRAGRLVSWNAGAAGVYGYPEAEAVGKEWGFLVPPAARELVDEAVARVLAGGEGRTLELGLLGKGGRPIPVEISFSAIRDSRGEVVGTSAISQDLTEKKHMLEVLIQSEKLAEIGRMGSGIVHEIKNPLTSIMMMSDIIIASPEVPEKTRRYADIIQKESQRILRLSQNILSFARPQKPEMKPTDVNRVLAETLGLTEYELKKAKVRVLQELDGDAPPVWGDGEKLKQVLLNLVMNACHAMPEGGQVEVRSHGAGRTVPPLPDGGAGWERAFVGDPPAGPVLTLSVEDRGSGIPAEILAKIFEPFFSTKGEGKGTGLGLYISRNIVLEHRGRIEVASRVGAGTRFTITLPVAPPAGPGPARA